MSDLTVNGAPVLSATLDFPRSGVWVATCVLDSADVPELGAATVAGDRLELRGALVEAGEDSGTVTVRLVGGAGRLGETLAPRAYRNAPLSVIVADIAREAGETLARDIDPSVARITPAQWTRAAVPAAVALATALDAAGASWRFNAAGELWYGRDTYPSAELPSDAGFIHFDAIESATLYQCDSAPALQPATTLDGRRASRLSIIVAPDATRLRVHWEAATPAALDRVHDPLTALVRAAMRDVLYHALIPAAVLAHDANGTLQVQPELAAFPAMVGVPLRVAGPGIAHRVARGARVLLAFEGGDPGRPVAVAFAPDNAAQASITLDATGAIKLGASATRGVARLNDTVDVGNLALVGATVPGAPPTGSITLTYTDGAGVAQAPVTIALASPVTPFAAALDLIGKVSSASSKVAAQ